MGIQDILLAHNNLPKPVNMRTSCIENNKFRLIGQQIMSISLNQDCVTSNTEHVFISMLKYQATSVTKESPLSFRTV